MKVTKEFTFDAAHFLTRYHGACERMHGHTYRLRVTVEGDVQENGLVIDFAILKKIVKDMVLDKLDHQVINDILPNPSAELMTIWIWDQLSDLQSLLKKEIDNPNLDDEIKKYLQNPEEGKKDVPSKVRLYEIVLYETPTSCVSYRGE